MAETLSLNSYSLHVSCVATEKVAQAPVDSSFGTLIQGEGRIGDLYLCFSLDGTRPAQCSCCRSMQELDQALGAPQCVLFGVYVLQGSCFLGPVSHLWLNTH